MSPGNGKCLEEPPCCLQSLGLFVASESLGTSIPSPVISMLVLYSLDTNIGRGHLAVLIFIQFLLLILSSSCGLFCRFIQFLVKDVFRSLAPDLLSGSYVLHEF